MLLYALLLNSKDLTCKEGIRKAYPSFPGAQPAFHSPVPQRTTGCSRTAAAPAAPGEATSCAPLIFLLFLTMTQSFSSKRMYYLSTYSDKCYFSKASFVLFIASVLLKGLPSCQAGRLLTGTPETDRRAQKDVRQMHLMNERA